MTKVNLNIEQGSTFRTSITMRDDDDEVIALTGYTGTAMLRKHPASVNSHSFVVNIAESNGVVTLSMTANTTANIMPGRYMYDCKLVDSTGDVSRVVSGIVEVSGQVTR